MVFVFFDAVDQRIISMLKADARVSLLRIAKAANVSEGCVRKRLKQLRQEGIIEGFTAIVNPKLEFEAIVAVRSDSKKTKKLIGALSKLGPVRVFEVTGKYDFFCIVAAASSKELNGKIDEIRGLDGVNSTETFIVMGKK